MHPPFQLSDRASRRTRWRGILLFALLAPLAACGPASRSSGTSAGPAAGAAALADLRRMDDVSANWILAEGVTIAAKGEAPAVAGQGVIELTADTSVGSHRVALEHNFGPGLRTYHIDVWVRPAGGVDAMIEAADKALGANGRGEDYGVGYFDLTGAAVAEQIMTGKTRAPNLAATRDGGWVKLSGDIPSHDGWVVLVIGMVHSGSYSFAGDPAQKLTIGGVKIEPAR